MSSEASSEQLCACEGAGYNKVYPSGWDDPSASYSERVPFANSSSEEEEEDSDVDGLESSTNEDSDEENVKSPIRSVVGPDSLRKFVLPFMWTVNNFNSTIKRKNFDTLRERYQIHVDIPIRLPFKFEKCYY